MPLELSIVTPQGEAFRGTVDSVVLPGSEGDFGVLPQHERFLTPLRIGEVEIRTAAGVRWAAISEGFADVSGSEVAVMVEACELAGKIDAARAQRARERAEQALRELDAAELHRARVYDAALRRAVNRIAVSQKASR